MRERVGISPVGITSRAVEIKNTDTAAGRIALRTADLDDATIWHVEDGHAAKVLLITAPDGAEIIPLLEMALSTAGIKVIIAPMPADWIALSAVRAAVNAPERDVPGVHRPVDEDGEEGS